MLLHATCVEVSGQGLLILGDSGSGKTSLACELMVRGARLVADDQVQLTNLNGRLRAVCPQSIRGKIELRGFGVVDVEGIAPHADIFAAVTLQDSLPERLPDPVPCMSYEGCSIPHYPASFSDHALPSKLIIFMKSFRLPSTVSALHLASGSN